MKADRRRHGYGFRWLVLTLLGVGSLAAGACSSDDAPPGDTPESGGQGGESNPAPPAAAGTGVGGGSEGGVPSVPTAGQAGAAGAPVSAGEVCVACGDTACTDKLASCRDNAECSPWLDCLTACDSDTCIEACDATYIDAARLYSGIYDCLCGACADDCALAQACTKTTCVDDNPLSPTETVPATLAETGLFLTTAEGGGGGAGGAGSSVVFDAGGAGGAPFGAAVLAPYVRQFEPKYPLWADGALKRRYIYIPRCSTINTDDMDHWSFPVGTRLWKDFSVDGTRVETRMMHHFGPGQDDWIYAAYQWDQLSPDDPAAAKSVLTGVVDANGTAHDIPAAPGACVNCHGKLAEKVLGFSAFQLSHPGSGETIERISQLGWLTTPAPDGFQVPGTPVEQAALGYLHGNCGGCHNSTGQLPASAPMLLRLLVAQQTVATTDTLLTTVGILTKNGNPALLDKPRIDPMAPGNSTVLLRMKNRGGYPMPPLGSELPDLDGGVKDVEAWVNSLPLP
jgi:hypothetical protein